LGLRLRNLNRNWSLDHILLLFNLRIVGSRNTKYALGTGISLVDLMFAICLDHGISYLGWDWLLLFNHPLLIFLLACLLCQFVLEICKFSLSILLFDKNSLTLSLFRKSLLAYLCKVLLLCWLLGLLHHLLSLGLIATIGTLDKAIKLAHVLLEYVFYAF